MPGIMTRMPRIIHHFTVFEEPGHYLAWPALARTADGDLIVLFTRTDEHMGPQGAIWSCRSRDQGETWEPPVVVRDTLIDDRESGLTTLQDGSLLAHIWSTQHTESSYRGLSADAYAPGVVDRWIERVNLPDYREASHLHGAWNLLSTDGGHTWSDPVRGPDSIHGGIHLASGALLTASYRNDENHIGIYRTSAPLQPWERIAVVRCPQPDSVRFGEPHLTQLPGGRIILMIRATAIPYDDHADRCFAWISWSDDDGDSWAEARPTDIWGYPPHLLTLQDGRVLATYGYRRPPYGERACLSRDGIHWDPNDELILRDDAPNHDLGYPHSIELEPGKILTVYYQPNVPPGTRLQDRPPRPDRVKTSILGTLWELPAE